MTSHGARDLTTLFKLPKSSFMTSHGAKDLTTFKLPKSTAMMKGQENLKLEHKSKGQKILQTLFVVLRYTNILLWMGGCRNTFKW